MTHPTDTPLLRTSNGNPLTLREIINYLADHPAVCPGDPLDAPLILDCPPTSNDRHRDCCALLVTNDRLHGRTLMFSNALSP